MEKSFNTCILQCVLYVCLKCQGLASVINKTLNNLAIQLINFLILTFLCSFLVSKKLLVEVIV